MKRSRFISVFLLISVLTYCKKPVEKQLVVLDLDKDYPSRGVLFTEIMKDIRIVPLETKEESLIPSNFRHLLGDKYIFIFSRDNILQFTTSGKFVRNLAKAGKGPGEFNYITSFALNPTQDKLYISHQAKELLVLDVESGSTQRGVPMPESVDNLIFVNDSILFGTGGLFAENEWLLIDIRSGQTVDKKAQSIKARGNARAGRGTYLGKFDDKIFCLFPENDTLYQFIDNQLIPSLVFSLSNKIDYNHTSVGKDLYFRINTPGYMIFSVNDLSIKKSPNSVSINVEDDNQMFYLDKNTSELFEVSSLYNDVLQIPVKNQYQLMCNGSNAYVIYSALDFTELVEAGVKDKSDFQTVLDKYLDVSQLNIEDNPLFFIGNFNQ